MNKVIDIVDNQSNTTDYIYKSIIIGDANTGKTTINEVYVKSSTCNAYYEPTIGIEFGSKIFKILAADAGTQNDINIKLHAWDTAGQEAFRSIIRSYYRDICMVFLVYDITNRKSFENLNFWLNEYHRHNPCDHSHFYILIGTKLDLEWKRHVTYEEGWNFAKSNGFEFIEINALNCNGLHNKIKHIIQAIYSSNLLENECPGIRTLGSVKPKNTDSIKFETLQLDKNKNNGGNQGGDNNHSSGCCN